MNRLLASLVLLISSVSAALPMQQASSPPKFPITWGNSAGSAYIRSIPVTSQIGVQNCAASLTDGFPPLTFVPASAGGCPPFGEDFNGILKQLSQWNQWGQAGGPVFYDSAFAASIGGYPRGATLMSAVVPGNMWMSTADDNATNPDAGGANWIQAPGQVPTGTPVPSLIATAPPGYVTANGATIGDASSGATGRANADTQFLFAVLWSGCPAAQCPIFTSTGSGSTRGASAAVDYAAHKAVAVWNLKGLGLMGVDTMGGSVSTFLSGVPVTSGSSTVPGSIFGENLHVLTAVENAAHTHANTLSDPGHLHVNTLTDPGHAHSNTLTDPGHNHTISNPNNLVGIAQAIAGSFDAAPGLKALRSIANPDVLVSINGTGISINNISAMTGISINNVLAGTGISINNIGSGGSVAHNTVERSALVWWNIKL